MNKISFLISIVLLFVSCSQPKQNRNTSLNTDVHIIDLDNISIDKNVRASSIFNKVTPIVLQSSEDVIIGKISNLQIYENKIYILDRSLAKSLFVFAIDGTFLYRIGKSGQGPGEYTYPTNFTIDKSTGLLYILDSEKRSILTYNLDSGEYIDAVLLNSDRICRHIQANNKSIYIDANYKNSDQCGYLLYEIDSKTGNDIYAMLEVEEYNKGWLEVASIEDGFFHSRNEDSPKYTQLFMDTVIGIRDRSIYPFLAVRSKRWIKQNELKSIYEESGLIGFFEKLESRNQVYGISRLTEYKDYVIFNIMHGKQGTMQIIYNTETKEAKMCEWIFDDLLFKEESLGMLGKVYCTIDGKICTAGNLNESFLQLDESTKSKILKEDIKNRDEILSQSIDSNPILFLYE